MYEILKKPILIGEVGGPHFSLAAASEFIEYSKNESFTYICLNWESSMIELQPVDTIEYHFYPTLLRI